MKSLAARFYKWISFFAPSPSSTLELKDNAPPKCNNGPTSLNATEHREFSLPDDKIPCDFKFPSYLETCVPLELPLIGIDLLKLPLVTHALSQEFKNAKPFPYIVIENFIGNIELLNKAYEELGEPLWAGMHDSEASKFQINKLGISNPNEMERRGAVTTAFLFREFARPQFVQWLSQLTGLPHLESDPDFTGGGIHRIGQGGKLSIHADFNYHPQTNKRRRINALLYLNKHWHDGMGGELELWNRDVSKCEVTVPPKFNTLVVFEISDDALHGHPEPWCSTVPRLSFALYYFTPLLQGEQRQPFHWASWKERKNLGF